MIRIRFLPRVPKDVRAEVRRLAAGFRRHSEVRHRLYVTVAPHPSVQAPDGGIGFGVCESPPRRSRSVRIALAAGLARVYQRQGGPRHEAVRAVGHCFLHELAHYEQWRDRRPMIEAGVDARATALYRKIDAPAP